MVDYKDITKGFIVSKCYVIEDNIIYDSDGNSKIVHKVFFPFRNLEILKKSLKNEEYDIGEAEVPKYNTSHEIYPITIVDDLYESYESAKVVASEKNSELINYKWEYEYGLDLKKEFEEGLDLCYLYELLVQQETKFLCVNQEKIVDKEKFIVKVLKHNK